MKKAISILLVIIILSTLTSCSFLIDVINPEIEGKYEDLLEMLLFLDIENGYDSLTYTPTHMTNIHNLIEQIPSGYKDIDAIKTEYNQICPYFKALFNTKKTYSARHQAAMDLLKMDSRYTRWDITRAIFHYMECGQHQLFIFDEIFEIVLLGTWKDSYGSYLKFYEKEDGDIWFVNNLPTDKESDRTYNYFIDGMLIKYADQENKENKFNAFRIIAISSNSITVHCYKNSRQYILTYDSADSTK